MVSAIKMPPSRRKANLCTPVAEALWRPREEQSDSDLVEAIRAASWGVLNSSRGTGAWARWLAGAQNFTSTI